MCFFYLYLQNKNRLTINEERYRKKIYVSLNTIKNMKKLLLSLFMLMPLMASAEEYSGTTGYCTWHLDTETGVLKISGESRMYDYSFTNNAPWHQYLENIRTVEITDGVTTIGTYSFYECSSLTSISMPNSVVYIGLLFRPQKYNFYSKPPKIIESFR